MPGKLGTEGMEIEKKNDVQISTPSMIVYSCAVVWKNKQKTAIRREIIIRYGEREKKPQGGDEKK